MRRTALKSRIVAVIMAMSMMLSLVSCDMSGFRAKMVSTPLSEQDLVRLMVNAINDKKAIADSYAAIPEIQRDGLSYSYFIQFIDIMTGISESNSGREDVSYFRMLSDEEVFAITEEMDDSYYGNIRGAELLYGDDQMRHGVYLMFSEDDDGMPYISEEWISDVIDLYNYGGHYFEMIDSDNVDGLSTLMRPGLDPEIYSSDAAVTAKAQEVLDYYDLCVRGNDLSNSMKSMVTVLLPGHICITIPETLNYNSNRVVKHEVDITMDQGSFTITDDIPIQPDITLTQVSRLGEELFTCGNTYTATQMINLMGESTRTTYYENTGSYSVFYDGLILIFDVDDYQSDDDWVGVLTTIKILGDSDYSVGNDLSIGMSRTAVIEAYPYIYPEYEVEVDNGYEDCMVQVGLDPHNNVSYIRITVV
jgi:hypothetical protein